jgi:uncharacterized protein (DUF302 family)
MPEGLVSHASSFGPAETIQRLRKAIEYRGMTVVAQVDHAAAAERAGMTLRPTTVLIFGNPRAGTPLMQAAQTAGIDLPLKALVWQDGEGKTWVSYNDPQWVAARHQATKGVEQVIDPMSNALAAVAREATTAS